LCLRRDIFKDVIFWISIIQDRQIYPQKIYIFVFEGSGILWHCVTEEKGSKNCQILHDVIFEPLLPIF
jgi:hypothetical protein